MRNSVTYDRPVNATLVVKLADGTEWPATDEDLLKFGYSRPYEGYVRFAHQIADAVSAAGLLDHDRRYRDDTELMLNPLRYLAETALLTPDLMDHAENGGWEVLGRMELALRSAGFDPTFRSYSTELQK